LGMSQNQKLSFCCIFWKKMTKLIICNQNHKEPIKTGTL
jgi:hypothetical protein